MFLENLYVSQTRQWNPQIHNSKSLESIFTAGSSSHSGLRFRWILYFSLRLDLPDCLSPSIWSTARLWVFFPLQFNDVMTLMLFGEGAINEAHYYAVLLFRLLFVWICIYIYICVCVCVCFYYNYFIICFNNLFICGTFSDVNSISA